MDVFIYQGALYCDECGRRIADTLAQEGVDDTGDSNDFPQGPYPDGGGEADSPQHCDSGASCLQAEDVGGRRVGAFLYNPLTSEGMAYVEQAHAEKPSNPLVAAWARHYGISGSADDENRELDIDDTHVETWFAGDRAHVTLFDDRTRAILIEWWDDDVRAAVRTGLLNPHDFHASAFAHWESLADGEATP